jgi:hypothetical protein
MGEPIPNETARNRRLRRQVARAFAINVASPADEYRYKRSVAIAEAWLETDAEFPQYPDGPKIHQAVGFVYPALQMRGDADNVAFLPSFVHSILQLEQVMFILVERADPHRFAYTFLTQAIASHFVDGTTIVWRDELPPEENRRCHVALEDGHWIQRDDAGNIYAVGPPILEPSRGG